MPGAGRVRSRIRGSPCQVPRSLPTGGSRGATGALPSFDPASGEVVAALPADDEEAGRAKVARAREAAAWWERQGQAGRRERLLAWRRVMTRRLDEVVDLLQRGNGTVRADAVVESAAALEHVGWAVGTPPGCWAGGGRCSGSSWSTRPARSSTGRAEASGDRPLQLPGAHPARLHRLRTGRGEHRGASRAGAPRCSSPASTPRLRKMAG
ncbi:aldehyde dehydrogenase family protein [Streptomyces sp. NPDC021019]|uniref:aldehyde dehydrogenase family protein n=1 Tax=Streptomyces sp. NPDC021019 TaxID=3365108 RepID=UPI0037AC49A5